MRMMLAWVVAVHVASAVAAGAAAEDRADSRTLARGWMEGSGLKEGVQAPPRQDVIVVTASETLYGSDDDERNAAYPAALAVARARAAANMARLLAVVPATGTNARAAATGPLAVSGVTVARTFRDERRVTLVAIATSRSIDLAGALREDREVTASVATSDPPVSIEAMPLAELMQRFGAQASIDADGRGCVIAFGMAPARHEGGLPAGHEAATASAIAALRHFAGETVSCDVVKHADVAGVTLRESAGRADNASEDNYVETEVLASASPRARALTARELRRWSATGPQGAEMVGVVLCATPGASGGTPPGSGTTVSDGAGGPHVILSERSLAEGLPLPAAPDRAALEALRARGTPHGAIPDGRVALAECLPGEDPSERGRMDALRGVRPRLVALAGLARELAGRSTAKGPETWWSHRMPGCVPLGRVKGGDGRAGAPVWQPILLPDRLVEALGSFEGRLQAPDTSCWMPATNWIRDASAGELEAMEGFRLVRDADGVPCVLAVGTAEARGDAPEAIEAAGAEAMHAGSRELARALAGQVYGGQDQPTGPGDTAIYWADRVVDASLPSLREERRWVSRREGGAPMVGVLVSCRLERAGTKAATRPRS